MNNLPLVMAYRNFYEQGEEQLKAGNKREARQLFLEAAHIANEISQKATTYETSVEYQKIAVKILEYVRKVCSDKPKQIRTSESEKSAEESDSGKQFTPEPQSTIRFSDVAGLDDVKDQIRYKVLEPLKNPERARLYNISPGAKILLYGPPGTGKTFISRAIAGEVNSDFYAVNCGDLISKYLGDSSKILSSLFDKAEKSESACIFFDEFDTMASRRSDSTDGADAEISRLVSTFLTRVDGFSRMSDNKMLLLIAATNRPWAIDSAMLRGGRFGTHIFVGVPDFEARLYMVRKALGNVPRDNEKIDEYIAKRLNGYGGGDIKEICRNVCIEAYMRSTVNHTDEPITLADCERAISQKPNMITDDTMNKFRLFEKTGRID